MQYQAEGATVIQGMDDMMWVGPHQSRRELGCRTYYTIKKIGKRDKKIDIYYYADEFFTCAFLWKILCR